MTFHNILISDCSLSVGNEQQIPPLRDDLSLEILGATLGSALRKEGICHVAYGGETAGVKVGDRCFQEEDLGEGKDDMNVEWTTLFAPPSDPEEGCACCLDTKSPGRKHLTSVVVQRSGPRGSLVAMTATDLSHDYGSVWCCDVAEYGHGEEWRKRREERSDEDCDRREKRSDETLRNCAFSYHCTLCSSLRSSSLRISSSQLPGARS